MHKLSQLHSRKMLLEAYLGYTLQVVPLEPVSVCCHMMLSAMRLCFAMSLCVAMGLCVAMSMCYHLDVIPHCSPVLMCRCILTLLLVVRPRAE